MSGTRLLFYVVLLVLSPAIPLLLFAAGEDGKIAPQVVYFELILAATSAGGAALLLFGITQCRRPLVVAIAASLPLSVGAFLLWALWQRAFDDPEFVAWLPIALFFVWFYNIPMILLITFCVSKIRNVTTDSRH